MNSGFTALHALGAGEFQHLNGSLADHLNGTRALLSAWSAPTYLQDAGLFHAAYGTAGFDAKLVATSQRENIVAIVGERAEEVVYHYCACDRDYLYPRFRNGAATRFKNRFTREVSELDSRLFKDICELTVANEIEISRDNPEFIQQHGACLYNLFSNMAPFLSASAIKANEEAFN